MPRVDLWRLRGDLEFRWVDGASEAAGYWVVKDPFARELFCLNPIEKQLLDLADGRRTVADLIPAGSDLIKPVESSMEAIAAFYVRARRKGLLVAAGPHGPLERSIAAHPGGDRAKSIPAFIGQLIAYRLPGVNPNRWIQIPESVRRLVTMPRLIVALLVIWIPSVAIIVSRFDQIVSDISAAYSHRDATWLLAILVSVAFAKSVHEMAHVVACRWVGAECREIGVMMLFGAPCLYCDVSDLWSVPGRFQRVFVSAAGMLAELVLAGLAVMVWALTFGSMLHDLALVIAVVCSISTIVVNANPLLRYDGYFIVADWLGVPNLADAARRQFCGTIRRIIWGRLEQPEPPQHVGRRLPAAVLMAYAISSGTYRLLIVAMLSMVIYQSTVDIGLGWLGVAFGISLLGAMSFRMAASVLVRPQESTLRWWQSFRPAMVVASLFLLTAVLFAIPFRSTVVAPALLVAADGHDLYASESGRIKEFVESGTSVNAGDVLFQLENDDLEDRLLQSQAAVTEAEANVQAWRARRGGDSASSAALALAVKRLQSAHSDFDQAQKRFARLTITAPVSGQFCYSRKDSQLAPDHGFQIGQWVPVGTSIGTVGHRHERVALALTRQNEIDWVRAGQSVRLRHGSFSHGGFVGVVRQVDRTAWESVPPELAMATTDSDQSAYSDKIHYLVRIDLEPTDGISMPVRTTVVAEIAVESRSIWDRLRRLFAAEFRGL
ncbi:MAG: biotin/lipoyl-binding protein [Planctomycetales bacterium]|nr:biotin/lipoyl-binding protein [Planctomycetales bacterium]